MDTLSNMLSAMKNGIMSGKLSVEVPYSKASEKVLHVMKDSKVIENYKVFKESEKPGKKIHVDFIEGKITDLRRVSKPGRRIYRAAADLKTVSNGFGIGVVSTSRGVMSVNEAKKKKLGGEVICEIW
jgi:small subunit ribosomal protein S8